jgi:16S rRNA (cytidine1402-2'-O)-methyltransferase
VVRGTAAELAARYADDPPRGEVVLVVAPPEAASVTGDAAAPSAEAVDAVARLVKAGAKPRVAAGVVAELTGGSANALYRAAAEKR